MAAARVLRPSGTLVLSPGARPDPESLSAQQPTVTVTAPSEDETPRDGAAKVEERENEQNERQASKATSQPKASPGGGDQHNETTVSEVSADITLDSVKDHTQAASATTSTSSMMSRTQQQKVATTTTTTESTNSTSAEDGGQTETTERVTVVTTTVQSHTAVNGETSQGNLSRLV